MKVVFHSAFERDRTNARRYYAKSSDRAADDLDQRIKGVLRIIADRKGGDHVGPHGYPCRRCSPFPYLVYYRLKDKTLQILGLVHESRHPDYLRQKLEEGSD